MLQRAALVNSVLCREAMLLGRIMEMEEEEAARVKKKKKKRNTRLKGGEAGNLCNRLLLACSLFLSLLVLVHCDVVSFISFSLSYLTLLILLSTGMWFCIQLRVSVCPVHLLNCRQPF